jgi:hypothetical protein
LEGWLQAGEASEKEPKRGDHTSCPPINTLWAAAANSQDIFFYVLFGEKEPKRGARTLRPPIITSLAKRNKCAGAPHVPD